MTMPTVMAQFVSMANGLTELRMRISPAEEAELIARAQTGDVEAFCALAANHQRSLYLLALKYSGNHHDAEDLTQEVMLNAYKAIQQFRGLSSFHTWLARIMVNCFLNHKRKSDPLASPSGRTPRKRLSKQLSIRREHIIIRRGRSTAG